MHVALIHDALIPPQKYGGTERIIYWLAKALNALGHRTTLVAKPGSQIPGTGFIPYSANWEEHLPKDVDLLHLWATPQQPPKLPFVVTIEGNGQAGEKFHPNTLFISKKHAENHGARYFVYNGIDPDDYVCKPSADREDSLVFLAKASWKVKNLEGAIAIARAANMKLDVLGTRDWPLGLHKLRPRIGGVRFHGMVGDVEKRKFLSKARALLFPVRWHEPFGIAITEALASGCAVFGTPYGSLPELVTPEVGVLSMNARDLVSALKDRQKFSSEKCRARVLAGLTHIDMARSYLGYYENVLRNKILGPEAKHSPQAPNDFTAQTLLPWNSI